MEHKFPKISFSIDTEADYEKAVEVRFCFEVVLKSGTFLDYNMPNMSKEEAGLRAHEIASVTEAIQKIILGDLDEGDTGVIALGTWRITSTEVAAFRCYMLGYEA